MSSPAALVPLPGAVARPVGGTVRTDPEDFLVEELPLYPASGSGEHLMLLLEKRDWTTAAVVARLASFLRVDRREIGVAGWKDRHAVTRQWITVPARAEEGIGSFELNGVRILESTLHRNKLRLGHLAGNRFRLRVRDPDPEAGLTSAGLFSRLAREGLPNVFGEQRFGTLRNNHVLGAALVRGDATAFLAEASRPSPGLESPRMTEVRELFAARRWKEARELVPRDMAVEAHLAGALVATGDVEHAVRSLPKRWKGFLLSAWQSAAFNAVLSARSDSLGILLAGEIAWKHQGGACFAVEDPAGEAPRAAAFEISPTGPLPGRKLLRPTLEAGAIEERALLESGCPEEGASDHLGAARALPGARRPLRVPVGEPASRTLEGGDLELAFTLPPGSFATVILGLLGAGGGAGGAGAGSSDD